MLYVLNMIFLAAFGAAAIGLGMFGDLNPKTFPPGDSFAYVIGVFLFALAGANLRELFKK